MDEANVHRPELFSQLTGVGPGQSITPVAFARALAEGPLSRVPRGARRAALLTGVEPGPRMAEAAVVTRALWRLGVENVVFASPLRRSLATGLAPLKVPGIPRNCPIGGGTK